jgi:hypothetical protein
MRYRKHSQDSAQSETPGMHGNSTREDRETPSTSVVEDVAAGRLEKALSQKSNMHVGGESDGRVVNPDLEDLKGSQKHCPTFHRENGPPEFERPTKARAPGLRRFSIRQPRMAGGSLVRLARDPLRTGGNDLNLGQPFLTPLAAKVMTPFIVGTVRI